MKILLCCWSVRLIDERENKQDEVLIKFLCFFILSYEFYDDFCGFL